MKSSPNNEKTKRTRLRVIKVGGSLFTMPDLKKRLMEWSNSVADDGCVNVWVAGGGALVDEVRNWQTLHGLGEQDAHRISIGLMSQTARLLQSQFPEWRLLADVKQLEAVGIGATPNVVFDCCQWALSDVAMQRSWETTSDTISLRLAIAVKASHLFLLKSRMPKSNKVADVIEEGLVDRNFAKCVDEGAQLVTSIANLRASNDTIELFW